jgi:hypothetical protein
MIGTSGGLMLTVQHASGLHELQGIHCLIEEPLASKKYFAPWS